MHRSQFAPVVLFTVACAASPAKPPRAERPEPEPAAPVADVAPAPAERDEVPEVIVRSTFETNALAIRPGKELLLVVRLDIHPGYRVFWKNPGEVGKATQATFEAPEGFDVGPVLYPTPQRFVSKTGVVSYGYEGRTALFSKVRAPGRLARDEAHRFGVSAQWYACKRQCSTENAQAFFELVVDTSAATGALDPEVSKLFESVPIPLSQLGKTKHRWRRADARAELTLSASEVEWLDFYPATRDDPKLLGVAGKDKELTLSYAQPETPPSAVRGTAIARVAGAESSIDIDLPWEP